MLTVGNRGRRLPGRCAEAGIADPALGVSNGDLNDAVRRVVGNHALCQSMEIGRGLHAVFPSQRLQDVIEMLCQHGHLLGHGVGRLRRPDFGLPRNVGPHLLMIDAERPPVGGQERQHQQQGETDEDGA